MFFRNEVQWCISTSIFEVAPLFSQVEQVSFDALLAGFELPALDDGTAFWKTEACLEKLERSLVPPRPRGARCFRGRRSADAPWNCRIWCQKVSF